MVEEGLLDLINPLSALVAGLVTSLHCMGMCGPLACAMLGSPSEIRSSKLLTFGGYHLGKIVSYSLIGALAGAIGARFVAKTTEVPAHFLTWSMAIFFLLIAIGLDRIALKLPLVGKLSRSLMQKAYRVHGGLRGLSLGLATPLVPCGPLYLMVWIAALSGNVLDGTTMLAMFGLGTIPGLLVTQLGWGFLSLRVNPDQLSRWRRKAALIACGLLVMRSFMDTSFSTIIAGGALCH